MQQLRRSTRRAIAGAVLVGSVLTAVELPSAKAGEPAACAGRVLILTAMPLELNPIIAKTAVERQVVVEPPSQAPRTFYFGSLDGSDVVLAMSSIGMVNASQTTHAAFDAFGACFRGVLFSGVAGSTYNIGDVAIAQAWTIHASPDLTPVDPVMYETAKQLEAPGAVELSQSVPVGDAACLCPGVDAATPVTMPQPMAVHVGGQGSTYDTFSDHAVPCMPGGGDVAGCKPCITTPGFDQDAAAFAKDAPPILTPEFFSGLFGFETTTSEYVSQDEETAPVAKISAEHGVPFLGVRAVSDGPGDPLGLPGFPFQFFTYRQLAGNNAAAVTIAFLELWGANGYPTAG
jgi:nucleoside phosphorylase